jgi:uncharacterized membrane protein
VASAAIWTGGLAFLVFGLLVAEADRWPLATRAVPRFSNMAVGSVVALLTAGVISAYLQLRTWSALWDNQYGLLVLTKIVLVVPLLALGAYNNRYAVPRLKAGMASVLERRRFLRVAGVELGIMVVIVGVTAVLVNSEPSRTMALEMETGGHAVMGGETTPSAAPFEGTVVPGDRTGWSWSTGHGGDNTTRSCSGRRRAPTEVGGPGVALSQSRTARSQSRSRGARPCRESAAGIAGDWELRIEALMGEFDLLTETVTVPIQAGVATQGIFSSLCRHGRSGLGGRPRHAPAGEWEAGAFATVVVRVPNERDDAETTTVTVQFPSPSRAPASSPIRRASARFSAELAEPIEELRSGS